jgi:hypothetical protein
VIEGDQAIAAAFEALARAVKAIVTNVPTGQARTGAIRKIREARQVAFDITHGDVYYNRKNPPAKMPRHPWKRKY